MSYLYHMTGSRAVAEEIAQEVFLRVFRYRERYTVSAKFTTWLWTIARNAALDHLRKRSEEPFGADELLFPFDERSVDDPEAERLAIEKSTREAIAKCLGQLTLPQREAISLRIFSEMSYEEVAGMLKLSPSSVKSLIHRARIALTDCLKGRGYGR